MRPNLWEQSNRLWTKKGANGIMGAMMIEPK